jgi:hypothetical protein
METKNKITKIKINGLIKWQLMLVQNHGTKELKHGKLKELQSVVYHLFAKMAICHFRKLFSYRHFSFGKAINVIDNSFNNNEWLCVR